MPEPRTDAFLPERRVEGPAKLSGRARFTADLAAPGALELAYAAVHDGHAEILSIDVSAALAVPGVELVLTGEDVAGMYAGRMLQDQPVLARDRVRFAGERVAVVAAQTRRAAQAAARAIVVKTRPLPPLLDLAAALADDAPVLHPDAAEYRYLFAERPPVRHPNVQGEVLISHHGEALDAAFAQAAQLFDHTFTTARQHAGYLEPHATLVEPLPDGRLRVRSSNKNPFLLRGQLAATLGLAPDRLVIEPPFIGGDFGAKGMPFDEPLCCLVAQRTGRAVRCVMSYAEELEIGTPRHATRLRLRTAVDREGRITAHEAQVVFDGGAYAAGTPVPSLVGGILSPQVALSTLTPYAVPVARISFTQVYTTTVPAGHVRAPGELQTQFASERHIDLIARAVGARPLAFRRRHAMRDGERAGGGEHFRRARAEAVLDRLEAADRARPVGQSAAPERVRGRGFALGVRELHGGTCAVALSVRPDGRIEVLTAQPDQGAGSHTMMQRVAARGLDVPLDAVVVRQGGTDAAPFDFGSAASRVTWVAGRATLRAAGELKKRLETIGAGVLDAESAVLRDGVVTAPGAAITLRELAPRLRADLVVEVTDDGRHAPGEPSDASFSGYLVDVEVDVETGAVQLLDAIFVADVGAIISPTAHAGQLQGGFSMGVGAALMEELILDETGRATTLSLAHYKLPSALDVPALQIVLLEPDDGPGPFGAKFAGELSTAGVAPAIANAVADACGAQARDLPLTAERLLGLLGPA